MLKHAFLTTCLLLLFMNLISQNEVKNPKGIEFTNPAYKTTLSLTEFSILNGAMIDGLNKYQGNIELDLNVKYLDSQVFYDMRTTNKRVFEVLSLYVAQKSVELLKVVDINNPSVNDKVLLGATSSLSQKIETALQNPVWEIRKVAGMLTNDNGHYFVSANEVKTELTGLLNSGLDSLTGKKVIVTGFIKEPGKIEMTGIHRKKEKNLELFIMSQCPYGIQALKYVFEKTDKLPANNQVRLEVHYIFTKRDSIFISLHGEPEIVENLVQMVIRDKYPQTFVEYLRQRIVSPSESWQQIAEKSKMDKKTIRQIEIEISNNRNSIIQNEYSYMIDNFQQINASPTYIWESEIIKTLEEIPGFQGGSSHEIQKCNN